MATMTARTSTTPDHGLQTNRATPASKVAMSRALGAAFLNHQVEQLEKSVNEPQRGAWRERERKGQGQGNQGQNGQKRNTGRRRDDEGHVRKVSNEDTYRRRSEEGKKDADVVVVDASVLVHGIHHLKRWCREGREEVVIVPLEALNTLDLLKKSLNSIGSRARAASRILEAQVGTNPRIRVQQDDAFVFWDKIDLSSAPASEDKAQGKMGTAPEWVRRTVCCARWEVVDGGNKDKDQDRKEGDDGRKVVLAICCPGAQTQTGTGLSPKLASVKLGADESIANPVPLPAPAPVYVNKHEQRCSGGLVGVWAKRAGVEVVEVGVSAVDGYGNYVRGAGAEGEVDREGNGGGERARKPRSKTRTYAWNRAGRGGGSGGDGPKKGAGGAGVGGQGGQGGMVERPEAVRTMMEMVSRPDKVVKVLARGEKLDPDT